MFHSKEDQEWTNEKYDMMTQMEGDFYTSVYLRKFQLSSWPKKSYVVHYSVCIQEKYIRYSINIYWKKNKWEGKTSGMAAKGTLKTFFFIEEKISGNHHHNQIGRTEKLTKH